MTATRFPHAASVVQSTFSCRTRLPCRPLYVFSLFCVLCITAAAQQGAGPPAPQITVQAALVNLEVTVTDAQGNFVSGLKRENFRILDDGKAQPLTHFAPEEAPAQILVLVETSPAVYLIHQGHLRAAYALLQGLAADDRVALGTYDREPRLLLNLTADKGALANALGGLRYNLGVAQLDLFDSLASALDWLAPLPGKKAIVLLTTGLDTSSAGARERLLDKLRASEVVVLPVALGEELREPARTKKNRHAKASQQSETSSSLSFQQADSDLEVIADASGGRAYFPKDARDFVAIYRQIAGLLRHQYGLGFVPPVRDARFHRVDIEAVDAQGQPLRNKDGSSLYQVRARRGYFAPAP